MLVLVVGPSGAGKDTLINAAKAALADDRRFVFPRRVVTRQAMTELEDHDSVTAEQFAQGVDDSAYAITWQAHGLSYGLPQSLWDDFLAGRVVVFNASRAIVERTQEMFAGTRVIVVEATPEVRARRLSGRGRESEAEVAERLRREVPATLDGAVRVDNSGDLQSGVSAFLAALRGIAGA